MVAMDDSNSGALTAPDEPHTRTLVLSVVRGMSEINRHMMEVYRSGSASAVLGVAQARDLLRLELRNLRMRNVKLPQEMETRFRMLCSQAEAMLALEPEPTVRAEELNSKFEPIEPSSLLSHADQGTRPRTIEAHNDVKAGQSTGGAFYGGIGHLHAADRPTIGVAPSSSARIHGMDGNPEFVSNNLVRREGELLDAQRIEALSETERARCMSERGNGHEMPGMNGHRLQSLPLTTQSNQCVACSPPPFFPPRSAPNVKGASDRPTVVGLARPGIKRALIGSVPHSPPAKQPFGGPDPGGHGITQVNALARGNHGRPTRPPTNAQVGEVIFEKPNQPNVSVSYCNPRNQVRYPVPYMFPPHAPAAQPGMPIQPCVSGNVGNCPIPFPPTPTSPMDQLSTTPPPTTFAASSPGGPPTRGALPPLGTTFHPSVPSTPPPIHPPTFTMPFPLGVPTSAPAMSHAQEELLGVSSRRLAREMMTSNRPPKDQRFSGNDHSIDFESHMCKFEKVTNDKHITGQMRLMEMNHWFIGPAAEIVSMYELEPNPTLALSKTKDQLRRHFGRQYRSASMMLEELLAGKKILEGEHQRLQQFVLSLQRIYMKAKQTGRDATFNNPDLIHLVLRRKLDHLIKKWATERVRMEERADFIGTDCRVDMDFSHFLGFLRRQLRISITNRHLFGGTQDPKLTASETKTTTTNAPTRRSVGALHTFDSTPTRPAPKTRPLLYREAVVNAERPASTSSIANAPTPSSMNPPGGASPQSPGKPTSKKWHCRFCEREEFHAIPDCETFRMGDAAARWRMVRESGVCTKCFQRGHLGRNCKLDVVCALCQGRHNTSMHASSTQNPNLPLE